MLFYRDGGGREFKHGEKQIAQLRTRNKF